MRYWILLLFCCFSIYTLAQEIEHIDINEINKGFRAPDSLMQLSYTELMEHFDIAINYPENGYGPDMDTLWATALAKTYIEKAKRNRDSVKIGRGYDRLSQIYNQNIKNADTCIFFTKNSNHSAFPTVCYCQKTVNFYKSGKYKEAMENAILAYKFARNKTNLRLRYFSKSYLNLLNSRWGDKKEGLDGYKKELRYMSTREFSVAFPWYTNEDIMTEYSSNIYSIAQIYLETGEFQKAKKYIDSGYFYNKKYKLNHINRFSGLAGVYYYRVGKYIRARDSINKYLKNKKDTTDYYALSTSAIYKGLILNKLNRQEEAIAQIKYADSLYQITDDEFEELTEGYKLLVDHYKTTGDETSQLMYLNKLIKLDSVITSNYITTNATITKNYTIPELEREKEAAIARLEAKNEQAGWGLWGLGSGLLLALGVGGYYFKTQRQYKQRFKEVLEQSKTAEEEVQEQAVTVKPQENPLDPGLVQRLDKAIKTFETEERFTATKITQKSLAEDLNTNSAYLSRYINQYKGKNFAQYLISLRINYAIQRLQKDKVLRSYTVDAIAEECGFGNSKSFTKAFKAAIGINPSYFIRNIEKEYAA